MNQNNSHAHPMTLLIDKVCNIFSNMGFDIADGPELEREWFNFDALNVPKDHPSRDMQDTFFLKLKEDEKLGKALLRTQTSDLQIRYMSDKMEKVKTGDLVEEEVFPMAIIAPGKVYRNEATDATHEAQFHQLEGLLVGEGVSLANLKGVLEKFMSEFFEKDIEIRLRSSFFPFVEPGVEIDGRCFKCGGSGCNICKGSGWIELGGAGMIHPNVLENCGINSKKYSGFAFGPGLDRFIMMKYGLSDIRSLYNGDLRVINQF